MARDRTLPKSRGLRGSNQTTVRDFNERLILHLIRRRGALTKADATRLTGLSPNAVSMIVGALEQDGLLLRGEPVRGRIGQPSVPLRLNPDARFHVGLKIGRQSLDMAIVDFCGMVRARRARPHPYPTPGETAAFVKAELPGLLRRARLRRADLAASGVAMPTGLWQWSDLFDADPGEMAEWRGFDAARDLADLLPGDILVENDATAACRAEWAFGKLAHMPDSVYFFVGTFIGGGIVLNGNVFTGCRGNAGGFGPLRVPDEPGGMRLVDHASLIVLQRMLRAAHPDAAPALSEDGDWNALEPILTDWIDRTARGLAHAVVSTAAVIDFEDVVIDGAFPPAIRDRIVAAVGRRLAQSDLQGVTAPRIAAGSFGAVARAVGAAAGHVSARHMVGTAFALPG
ncbi:ROK family protein [Meridianimarinicoccus sp. RP-17]|uniref:ROK family transcriptional regulator n=1 Tax=Meridianimarinicoccus zhengii TaxID=2056810 RepID=UPI000DAE6C37|nr:ROK family transcriptional regulator [Phycocomes zhengii]